MIFFDHNRDQRRFEFEERGGAEGRVRSAAKSGGRGKVTPALAIVTALRNVYFSNFSRYGELLFLIDYVMKKSSERTLRCSIKKTGKYSLGLCKNFIQFHPFPPRREHSCSSHNLQINMK